MSPGTATVSRRIGEALAATGVDTCFGVVGSGNFHLTNALVAAGATFVAARHEGGAAVMADAYARTSGNLGVLSLHQGPGVTNALTGIAEAAKSRTPMVVLAADTGAAGARSNFRLDQAALAAGIGAAYERAATPASAVEDVLRAVRRARTERRTVLVSLPLDVQNAEAPDSVPRAEAPPPVHLAHPASVDALAELIAAAHRPVFIAGRGARHPGAAAAIEALAEHCGALLATSAVAKGLFNGSPWYLDVAGGFASPAAAERIAGADAVVAWGCALNMWTTRHGRLIAPGAAVAQVDVDPDALHTGLGVLGDAAATATAVLAALSARGPAATAYRAEPLPSVRWRDEPFDDRTGDGRIDPRTLSIALDDLLPAARTVSVDSGNFMGYPSMYLSVPDAAGFCFTQAFQSIGLGLATAIGAAVARPDRLAVAALGDGGFLMGIAELETVVRLGRPMVIVVYDDAAYGAEVHHFGPGGHPLATVTFPDTDLAAIARGYGCAGVVVRTRPTWHRSASGCTAPATARCSSTRRSPPTAAPGGSTRRSAATDNSSQHDLRPLRTMIGSVDHAEGRAATMDRAGRVVGPDRVRAVLPSVADPLT
ncbi:thiamine pyrophosphate-binding protein [Dactylosporangium vinaceum]|uniref:Thiamine pyrophosphate-binding protein n=1 Tax=Dactylosporangium vinaceum TaxID=53362 RepID=A0ABV5MLB8_9ACTN|nr:thiamine pyrophosphate-binding protein [Dactylosporangium vinaceum]